MTATDTAPPAAGGPPPAVPETSRFSVEALRESRRGRAVLGLLLAAAVIGGVYLIVSAFTGHFTNVVKVNAELPQGSNAVPIAAPVEYRNVTVGKVGSETQAPDGGVAVQFDIYPKFLTIIPKDVAAQVEPLSIFGNQYINLVPPAAAGSGAAGTATGDHLLAGEYVKPYGGAPSSSLQGTVSQLYNLLNAVHPAQLDTALTAFATALNNEGSALGQTLADTHRYLGQAVVPNLSTIQSNLDLLGPVSSELQRSTPDVLGTLQNTGITAQTLTQQESTLHSLLTTGTSSIGRFGDVLTGVETSLPLLLNDSGPLFADITQSPTELSRTLSGLTTFASAVAANEANGPFLSVNANLPIADINAGVNAALGYDNPASISAALGSAVNPPTYTSANCPQYPGETNPYCGSGGSPAAVPSATTAPAVTPLSSGGSSTVGAASTGGNPAGGTAGGANSSGANAAGSSPGATLVSSAAGNPYAAELQAVQAIAAALNGGQAPASPGLADMVLVPLLSSMAGSR